MKILLYMDGWPGEENALLETVGKAVPWCQVEVLREAAALERRLARPVLDCPALVLAVGSARGLRDLDRLKGVLAGMDLLMLLPSLDRELAALGHGFFPRLLTSGAQGLNELGQFLAQLVARRCPGLCGDDREAAA